MIKVAIVIVFGLCGYVWLMHPWFVFRKMDMFKGAPNVPEPKELK